MSQNTKKNEIGITVKKDEDIVEWYSQVVLKSELADYSAVKGCAVIRPLGYELWQGIMDFFNARIKTIGVKNAYFPLFIPESFFYKEADHVEGFAPEVAWIERKSQDEERVAVRPTSETIMYDSYSKWIRSYRDLPLRINQWANIVRWEVKDVKMFLRSREFLWQEGHCVYETEEECQKETELMIKEYKLLSEELLAVPATIGKKSDKEKFPGAKYTFTIESFMPDGKALQAGTSHNLGQGFAKSFNITFRGKDEQEHYPWQSSWGFSTRLLGSLIMTHGDDNGLVLPPRLASQKAVIIPIINKKYADQSKLVLDKAYLMKKELSKFNVEVDDREEYSPGFKYGHWELRGIPIRIELGPRDLENNSCVLVKRNTGEKITVSLDEVSNKLPELLELMHKEMFDKAKREVENRTATPSTYDEFIKATTQDKKLAIIHHCGESDCEDEIKAESGGVTSRCRPLGEDSPEENAVCLKCGKPASYKIIFSRNY